MSHDKPGRRAELLDRIMTFIVVNMLWAVFAAFIISLPAATAGLFATLTPWVRGKSSEPFRDFFEGMRQYWRKSTMIVLMDVCIASLVALNLITWKETGIHNIPALCSRNIAFFVAAMTLLTNLYLWPLLVSVDFPIRQLIKIAMRLVVLHPVWSLFTAVVALIPLLSSLILPRFVAILIAFSSCALLISWGAWRVIEHHERDLFGSSPSSGIVE